MRPSPPLVILPRYTIPYSFTKSHIILPHSIVQISTASSHKVQFYSEPYHSPNSSQMSDKKKQAALPCEVVKKYPGQEQVELSVQILIPGHWFNGLVGAEKAKKFTATAVEYANCRQFGAARSLVKTEAIRFQVTIVRIPFTWSGLYHSGRRQGAHLSAPKDSDF